MKIPSPRQLNLKRFERPDFRSTTPRGKHAQGWTWSRALHRLGRWLMRANATLTNDLHINVKAIARTIMSLKARHPVWQRANVSRETLAYTIAHMREQAAEEAATLMRRTGRRQPHPLRTVGISGADVLRESTPARRSVRRPGAHRLEHLAAMGSKAYMNAIDARQRYVIASLLRLKGLTAAGRVNGESSWREARRADRYATA